jgi:predicted lipoprotein with Yx(FWY)xxD motif
LNASAAQDVVKTMEQRRHQDQLRLAMRVIGGGLLVATGAIHLDLYLTGYRSIPTIGWLFLLQLIAAFVLGAAVLVTGSRLASAAGALFAVATLGGYLLSLRIGLFGFREVRTTAGIVAGVIEVAAFVSLAVLALLPGRQRSGATGGLPGDGLVDRVEAGIPGAPWVVAAVSLVAIAALIVSVAVSESTTALPSGALLKVTTIHGVPVVTDSEGLTLYWFAPDTPTASHCSGSCAVYWPPVIGSPTRDPGVTGKLGSIKRSDGSTQATYDGHPLYTYIADSAPGQDNGNDINLNGGYWYQMTVAGTR